jgi:ABC-2 type transport system ATP-binding protein/lipopolysaccharide transport system ATP-binding protein
MTELIPTQLEIDKQISIILEDVSVLYRVPRERVSGIKEFAIRWLQRRLEYEDFLALHRVTFQVNRGEAFGVIGRNGSGKSTLLKVIAHVLMPRSGRVVTRGRIAPLLELGAGFQPELTGRENIFLNSALLGYTRRETADLLPEIIEFAEIGDFIDAPLRTYSTGMAARLGFSVATCIRPDILLVDEVLSVGDAEFQDKCLDRMYSYRQQGTTIFLVSHSMATIESFCDRALWLDSGKLMAIGPADWVAERYMHRERTGSSRLTFTHPTQPTSPLTAAQIDANLKCYKSLEASPVQPSSQASDQPELVGAGQILPAEILNLEQGAVTAWVKFLGAGFHPDAALLHTDDSRFVLYVSTHYKEEWQQYVQVIVGRAGGNRRVLDTYFGVSRYPEVIAYIDTNPETIQIERFPFTPDRWHLVGMSWIGHPGGIVRLYIDGELIGEQTYDSRYNDQRPWPRSIAIGMRPTEWAGELIPQDDGTLVDSRPHTTMSIYEAGIQTRDMRLYPIALTQAEIMAIIAVGPTLPELISDP